MSEREYPEALLERAADAVRRAAMELAAEAVTSTAHVLVIGAAAEARHRGVLLDEVAMGRVELAMAVAEVQRRHASEGTPDVAEMAGRVFDPSVWECVRRRAITLLRVRGQEEGWYGEVVA